LNIKYKGETISLHFYPTGIRYGNTEWHTKEQWLLEAWDYTKGDYREFAMNDIIQFH
jgi:hypothetical protein